MERYAAKLLFQFRMAQGRRSNQRRICEERIVIIRSRSAEVAYRRAMAFGKSRELHYDAPPETKVHFEFVGIQDLLKLDIECEKDEVWYDVLTMVRPKERARQIIPPKARLNAIYWERVGKLGKQQARRRQA